MDLEFGQETGLQINICKSSVCRVGSKPWCPWGDQSSVEDFNDENSPRRGWPCPPYRLQLCLLQRALGSQLCPALPVSPWWDLPPPGWELFLPPRLDRTSLFGRYQQKGSSMPLPPSQPHLKEGTAIWRPL